MKTLKEPQKCNSDLISRKKLIEDIQLIAKELNKDKQNAESDDSDLMLAVDNQLSAIWRIKSVINNQPQVQPIANDKTKLKEKLIEYFDIGDSSAYYLTRVKESFSAGTMTLDDFVEFTENDIDDLVDYLTKKEV